MRTLFEPLKKEDLDQQLTLLLANIEVQDLEQLMIVLRQFKQLNVFTGCRSRYYGVDTCYGR